METVWRQISRIGFAAMCARWIQRLGRSAAVVAAALTLGSCGPTWDAYVSKTTTMRLFTYVPCGVPVSNLPEHQTYYVVDNLMQSVGEPWVVAGYTGADGTFRVHTVYLSFVSYVGLQNYTALPTGTPPDWQRNPRCGVLLVLPWSDAIERPFYIPLPPDELAAAADSNVAVSIYNSVAVALLSLLIWIGLMVPGTLPSRRYRAFAPLGVLIVIGLVLSVVWFCAVGMASEAVQEALPYYRFYDALPRHLGDLLPLSWSQTVQLMQGPPYPPVSSLGYPGAFLIALWGSFAGWVGGCGGFVFDGLCHWFGPDLLGDLQQRAQQEGRAITPDDLAELVARASGTLSAQQLEQLKANIQERIGHER
jgi:hypothetical protein